MQRLRSQLALAAFLRDLGEAVEEAELVTMSTHIVCALIRTLGSHDDNDDGNDGWR